MAVAVAELEAVSAVHAKDGSRRSPSVSGTGYLRSVERERESIGVQ